MSRLRRRGEERAGNFSRRQIRAEVDPSRLRSVRRHWPDKKKPVKPDLN